MNCTVTKFKKDLIKSVAAAVVQCVIDCMVTFRMGVDNVYKPKKLQKINEIVLLACIFFFIYCICFN